MALDKVQNTTEVVAEMSRGWNKGDPQGIRDRAWDEGGIVNDCV